jgi:hypothetical protein
MAQLPVRVSEWGALVDDGEARRIIGLPAGPLTLAELRRARNDALQAHHPDKVGSDPAAVRRSTYWTAQINAAFEALSARVTEGAPAVHPPAPQEAARKPWQETVKKDWGTSEREYRTYLERAKREWAEGERRRRRG